MVGFKKTDSINNSDIYQATKDLYLSEKRAWKSYFKVCIQQMI